VIQHDADDAFEEEQDDSPRPPRAARRFGRLRLIALAALLVLAAGSPFWAPLLMRRMAFFHVKRIEILGAHYVPASDILARLHVDTLSSVWDPTAVLESRVAGHPEIASVQVRRKLPGTLVVTVTERAPVALVPASGGFRVYDERGVALPIDPSRVTVDAPVLMQRNPRLLHLLGEMRLRMPALYTRVSSVRAIGADEVVFDLTTHPVRAMQDVSLERLAEIAPVEADLNRKGLTASELDLRYRDQVIARLK
jgi:cell division protein FtsQ